jgi:hypothetical protein
MCSFQCVAEVAALYFTSGNNNHNIGNDAADRLPTSELGVGTNVGDPIVLNLAPLCTVEHSQQPQSLMSTFKGSGPSCNCDVIGM